MAWTCLPCSFSVFDNKPKDNRKFAINNSESRYGDKSERSRWITFRANRPRMVLGRLK